MPGRHDQPPHRLCQALNRTSPSGYDDVAVCRPSRCSCKPKLDLPKALHVAGPRPMTPLCVRPSSRVFLQGPRQLHDANALGHITHTRTHRHDLTKPTRPRCQEDTGSAATPHALPPVRHRSRSREGNGASRRHVHRVHDALHGLCPRGHGPPQIVPAVYGPAPASPPYTSPIHRSSIGAQTEPRGWPPCTTRVRAGPAHIRPLTWPSGAHLSPINVD